MTKVQILFVSFVSFLFVACSSSPPSTPQLDRRLSPAECEAAVDHAVALLTPDPMSAAAAAQLRTGRVTAVEQCLATATLRDHRCLMAARDARELGLCPMPGGR